MHVFISTFMAIDKVCLSKVIFLKFRTLVACQKDLDRYTISGAVMLFPHIISYHSG